MVEIMAAQLHSQVAEAEQVIHIMELVIVEVREQEDWLLFIINQIYKGSKLCQI